MAQSTFPKPVDQEIKDLNDKIGTVPSGQTVERQITSLNSKKTNYDILSVNSYGHNDIVGWDAAYALLPTQYRGNLLLIFKNNYNLVVMVNKYSATYGSMIGVINDGIEPYYYCVINGHSRLDNLAFNSKIGTVPSGQTVEGQITALNSKLTVTITPESNFTPESYNRMIVAGNVCFLSLCGRVTTTGSGWNKIAETGSNYSPSTDVYFAVMDINGGIHHSYINDNGRVYVDGVMSNVLLRGSVTWIKKS